MNNKNEIKSIVSGNLVVELDASKEALSLIESVHEETGIGKGQIAISIKEMAKEGFVSIDGEGIGLSGRNISLIKEFEAPEVPEVPEVPKTSTSTPKMSVTQRKAEFGVEEQLDENGNPFSYVRKAIDGKITQLDEEHQELKKEFQRLSKVMNNLRKTEEYKDCYSKAKGVFNGAGTYAITMWDPENIHANKEGKVFYRWTGQQTSEVMDILIPLLKVAQAEEIQEGQ